MGAMVKLERSGEASEQIARVVDSYQMLVDFVHSSGVMREGTDYGKVPGSDKPSLLKPGAEKLGKLFGLKPKFIQSSKVADWTGAEHGGEAFFCYEYTCRLYHGDPDNGGTFEAEAIRSCNSWESKYRYRWVPRDDIPEHLDANKLRKRAGSVSEPDFAIQKGETSGKYGKPAEYWEAFRTAIAKGTARKVARKSKAGKDMLCWEIDSTVYRIPNEDVFSQVNTIDGMAQKRAFVAATLLATNASEFFTLDLEDNAELMVPAHHVTDDGEIVDLPPRPPARPAQPPAEPVANRTPPANGSNLPANGTELKARLEAYESKLAKDGVCKPGELLKHVVTQGVSVCGYPADITQWTAAAMQFATDAVLDFVAIRKKTNVATAGPREPSAADPDGIYLDNWLREQGKLAHAAGRCENEDSLLEYVKKAGVTNNMPRDLTRWTGPDITAAVTLAKAWLRDQQKAVAA